MATSAQVALLSAHQNPYPGAILALDIIGSRTNGQQYYMLNGAVTTQFSSLPGLTVSRTTTGGVGSYGANADGSLVKFPDNVARITNQGLLVEESRVNSALQSQTLNNASWSLSALAVSADQIAAPDGTVTAELFTDTGVASAHAFFGTGISLTATNTYTASIFVKAGTLRYISLRGDTTTAGSSYPWITLDTQAGTIAANAVVTSSSVKALVNGWYRISVTWVAGATASGNIVIAGSDVSTAPTSATILGNSYTGGTGTFYVWGAQLEAGSFPTSYIPTSSASVSRSADVISIGGLSLSGDHTAVLESMGVGGSAIFVHSRFSDGTSNNYDQFAQFSTATQLTNQSVAGGVAQVSNNGAITQGAVIKSALTFGAGRYQTATGGVLGTAATGKTSFTASKLDLGHAGGSNQLNSYVRRVLWYPTAFTDAQLQSATQ